MDSGTSGADDFKERKRWGELSKVYTRRNRNKRLKNSTAEATTSTSAVPATTTVAKTATAADAGTGSATSTHNTFNEEKNSGENCSNNNVPPESSQTLANEDGNSSQPLQELNLQVINVVSDDSASHNPQPEAADEVANGNGIIKPVLARVDNRVRINLAAASSNDEIRELKRKFACELDQVRRLAKQLEEKEAELTSAYSNNSATYSQSQHSENNVIERRALQRANSEVGMVRQNESRPLHPSSLQVMENNDFGDRRVLGRVNSEVGSFVRDQAYRPFRNLNVSVVENNNHINGVTEFLEKEKRTPKANQYYRNSDFLLAKDRLPPESNKKPKANGGKKHRRDMEYAFGIDRYRIQAFRNCNNLLQRLMKHKHGWVFNEPVDAKLLGLHDYHDIIKHPMDLGTIKSRLARNFYKSPRDFAEDVRLTFRNAMTYNPKGQDVHVMAEQLSDIFEEKWAVIEAEYNPDWRYDMIHYGGLPTPTSRKVVPPPLLVPVMPMRSLGRSESLTLPIDSRRISRTPAPKKPKAKDPNKRDMTYEEKQKLSTNLQTLPPEKLDSIVEIIKKRNSSLCQREDEIEVEIDTVDAETLWELDRFVTNYKKNLSKIKRRAEIAQARAEAGHTIHATKSHPAVRVAAKDGKTDETKAAAASPVQIENQGDNDSDSSSSSSSSSDSGSSSSDSDSDSSSS